MTDLERAINALTESPDALSISVGVGATHGILPLGGHRAAGRAVRHILSEAEAIIAERDMLRTKVRMYKEQQLEMLKCLQAKERKPNEEPKI